MWLLLLRSPLAWMGAALLAVSAYAAVQHIGWANCSAGFKQFRAEVASEAAEAEVRNAQEAARHDRNAMEAVSDLQARYAALDARYRVLRRPDPDSSRGVPSAATAAPSPSAGHGDTGESDADARCLAIIEVADRELNKFRELWLLDVKNAKQP